MFMACFLWVNCIERPHLWHFKSLQSVHLFFWWSWRNVRAFLRYKYTYQAHGFWLLKKILQAEHAPWKRMYETSTFTSQDQLQIIRTANATGVRGLFRQRNLTTGLMREILQTLFDTSSWMVIYDSDVFPIFFPRNQGTVLTSRLLSLYQESWCVFPVDVATSRFMDSWPILYVSFRTHRIEIQDP